MEQDIQEYPKALYRDGAYMAVADQDEEDDARADGWDDWAADHARMSAATATAGDVDDEPAELTRDQMKAKAAELGLPFAHNISNAKLAELIAADKQ